MRPRNAFLLVCVVAILVFAAFNRSLIGTPLAVNYQVGSGGLPLAVILLVLLGVMLIFHLVTEWLPDASSAVDKWLTERKLREASGRAMGPDDDSGVPTGKTHRGSNRGSGERDSQGHAQAAKTIETRLRWSVGRGHSKKTVA